MPVDTKHPDYVRHYPDWRRVRLAMDGETEVKRHRETHLKMPGGMRPAQEAAETANKLGPYDRYIDRAEFPDWTASILRGMLGIAFENAPTFELPPRMASLKDRATPAGESLELLLKRIVRQVLQAGRYGLLADMEAGKPYICAYTAESIINWRELTGEGASYADLVVLEESYISDSSDKFCPVYDSEYLVLELIDGRYSYERWRRHEGETVISAESDQAANLEEIPFIFVGSTDLLPDIDEIPMLAIARAAFKYYQLSADYYHTLYMTSAPQYYVTGVSQDEAPGITGPSSIWVMEPKDAECGILEFSGAGAGAQRTAMQDTHTAAFEAGAKVADLGRQVESGEARQQRRADQQATLKSVVENSARGLERCLQYQAMMMGANPDLVKVTPNVDFDDLAVSDQLARVILDSVSMGKTPISVWFGMLREGGLTEKTDEELQDELDDTGPPGMGLSPGVSLVSPAGTGVAADG